MSWNYDRGFDLDDVTTKTNLLGCVPQKSDLNLKSSNNTSRSWYIADSTLGCQPVLKVTNKVIDNVYDDLGNSVPAQYQLPSRKGRHCEVSISTLGLLTNSSDPADMGKKVPIKAGISFDAPETGVMTAEDYNVFIATLYALCMGCLTIEDKTIEGENIGLPNFYQLLQGSTDVRENLS